jgi:hypothetical protein
MARLLVLLAAACAVLPARAQITVTQADVEAALSTGGTATGFVASSSPAIAALAAQTGANQTWDFTVLTYGPGESSTVTRVFPPVPGSDDPHLAQATHITRVASGDSAVYSFQQLGSAVLTSLGFAADDLLIRNVPGQTALALPATFGSTWGSTYELQVEPTAPGATTTVQESVSVVGWGTLVTPAGSGPALMIRTETTTTFSFPPLPPIVTTSANVQFSGYDRLSASIFLPSSGPPSATYNVFETGTAAEPPADARALRFDRIEPNPARAGAPVPLVFSLPTAAAVRLEVFDALGRRVGTVLREAPLAAGLHRATWRSAGTRPGVYLLRLTAGGQTATRPLTVAR